MNQGTVEKVIPVVFAVYSAAMLKVEIPTTPLPFPLWVFSVVLVVAWFLEGLKPDALQLKRANICFSVSGAFIPLAIALYLGFQSTYVMPFMIGLLIMAGLMFKLSKPDFLKGSIRFKLGYALAISYGTSALAALLMYSGSSIDLNIRTLAPLAGAVGTTGILIGNIATALELSSQKATPATFKQKIVLGGNGVRDVLWAPLIVAVILFTVPAILTELNCIPPILQQFFS